MYLSTYFNLLFILFLYIYFCYDCTKNISNLELTILKNHDFKNNPTSILFKIIILIIIKTYHQNNTLQQI